MTRVIVTDARLGSAVALIRSLDRQGIHVIAADHLRLNPGFYSKHSAERLLYPPPDAAPGRVVETLLEEARSRGVDLIFPVTDELVIPLSDARERFADVCRLALPEAEALETARDKLATVELARSLRIPTPRTEVVGTVREALAAVKDLRWPVVLKPQASRVLSEDSGIDAFGVVYAGDARDLQTRMEAFEGRCNVLLQEYCDGEAIGVALLTFEGTPLTAFQYRRLREVPFYGGPSSLRESVELETVPYEYAASLLRALRWTGLAMVEFKGRKHPQLMEINGRVWGSLALAVKSGVDFPALAAQLYLNGPAGINQQPYSAGVRSRDLRLEVSWIASVLRGKQDYPFLDSPRRREALAAAVRLFLPGDGFDVLSLQDPMAGLAEVGGLVPRVFRKARRSIERRAGGEAVRPPSTDGTSP